MIYTITAHAADPETGKLPVGGWRVFGYYPTEAEAVNAIGRGIGSMHECLYTHLVVEEVPPGIHAMATVVGWWRWDESHRCWRPTDCPDWARGVCNHAMG